MDSGVVLLPYPSALLQGIDIAALRICDVRPYISSFGNPFGILNKSNKTPAEP
jgi:hypothetical protein